MSRFGAKLSEMLLKFINVLIVVIYVLAMVLIFDDFLC